MKKKHIPIRMCAGCGKMKNKHDLIRLVKSKSVKSNTDNIVIDETFKHPGRGAYLCRNIECLKNARKTKRLNRAFSCRLYDELFEKLQKIILLENQKVE